MVNLWDPQQFLLWSPWSRSSNIPTPVWLATVLLQLPINVLVSRVYKPPLCACTPFIHENHRQRLKQWCDVQGISNQLSGYVGITGDKMYLFFSAAGYLGSRWTSPNRVPCAKQTCNNSPSIGGYRRHPQINEGQRYAIGSMCLSRTVGQPQSWCKPRWVPQEHI